MNPFLQWVSEHPAEALGAIGTACTALGALAARLWGYWVQRQAVSVEAQTQVRARVRELLRGILEETTARRALLLRVENGGRALKDPQAELWITIEAEDYQPELTPQRLRWQDWKVTPEYRADVIDPLLDAGSIRLNTEAMPPSELKDDYEVQGVREAHVRLIRRDGDRVMWYLSVHLPVTAQSRHGSPTAVARLEARERDTLASYTQRLRRACGRLL